jgi:hypothetical protein
MRWLSSHRLSRAAVLLLVGLVLVSCTTGDISGTLPQRVKAWASAAAFSRSTKVLVTDVERIDIMAKVSFGKRVATDCAVLTDDSREAYQELPTPSVGLTDMLDGAYHALYNGADACYEAGEHRDAAGVKKALAQLAKALQALEQGKTQVELLSREAGAKAASTKLSSTKLLHAALSKNASHAEETSATGRVEILKMNDTRMRYGG